MPKRAFGPWSAHKKDDWPPAKACGYPFVLGLKGNCKSAGLETQRNDPLPVRGYQTNFKVSDPPELQNP